MEDRDRVCASAVQPSPNCGGQRIQPTLFSDCDEATEQRLWKVPQMVAISDRAHKLGHIAAGHHPAELVEGIGTEDRIHG